MISSTFACEWLSTVAFGFRIFDFPLGECIEFGGGRAMKKSQSWAVVFCLVALSVGAVGQVENGAITGTVLDPSGAAVANAKITVTNQATNFSVSATTNATGTYNARELPVGNYKVTSEAQGFKTITNSNIAVNAGTVLRVDLKMELGQAR